MGMLLNLVDTSSCKMSGDLFVLACKKGYDSKGFIEKVMLSETGGLLYCANSCQMWLGNTYVMSELEQEIEFEKGKVINEQLMYWIGYLYRYWSIVYPEDTAKDIYTQAPFDTLATTYQGLHVLFWDEAIENLKEIYNERNNIKDSAI